MSDFRIDEVLGQESFSTEHGQFVSYEVRFSGEQGSGIAQHKRKASSPAPKAGDTIDAEIVRKGEKTELKRVWKQDGGGGRSGGSPRTEDPKKSAEIRRMASQKCALELLRIETDIAIAVKDEHSEKLFAKLRAEGGLSGHIEKRTSFFESHAKAAEA